MPMQVGTLMVTIRAQDFASRTLRRVGAEMGAMSREQQLLMRQQQLTAQKLRQAGRIGGRMEAGRGLRALRAQMEAEKQLAKLRANPRLQLPFMQGAGSRSKAITRLSNDMARLQDNIDKMSPSTQRLIQQMRGMPNAAAAIDAALAGNSRQLRALGAEAGATRMQLAALSAEMRVVGLQSFERAAHAMSGLGRTMQLFGALTVGALGLAAHSAAEFNKTMGLAATQARDIGAPASQTAVRLNQLSNGFEQNGRHIRGVLDLMHQYPADAAQMSKASYDIFSSMDLENDKIVDVAKGLALLNTANKIAVAGNVDLEEATNGMVTVLNNFDPQLKDVTGTLDTMFDIVRFGRMTVAEFNEMMNKVAPAAASARNSLEDVGGAMAYLTTVMPSQRMVATGISRLIEAFQRPEMVSGLKEFGIQVKNAQGGMKPFPQLIKEIAATFPMLRKGTMTAGEFFQMITSIGGGGKGLMMTAEGRRSFTLLLTHMDEYLEKQRQIEDNTGEFGKAYAAQLKTLGVQWDIFVNRLKAIGIAIGTDAIPAFASLGKVLKDILDAWEGLDKNTRQAIINMAVWGGAVTLLGGILLTVLGSLFAFEAMIRKFFTSVGRGMGTLRTFAMIARRLAAIGMIVLVLKVKKSGDPKLWDFLMASVMGAAVGSRFGLPGMVAGAALGPAIVASQESGMLEKVAKGREKIAAQKRGFAEGLMPGPLKEYNLELAKYNDYIASQVRNYRSSMGPYRKWYKSQVMTFEQFTANEAAMKSVDRVERNRTKTHNAELKESQKHLGMTKAQVAAAETYSKSLMKFSRNLKKYRDAMKQYREDMDQWRDSMKEWSRSLDQATKAAGVDAVNNLQSMYMQMYDVNKQALGELFQGPWLTSQTFDLAKEWGIKPRLQDLLKDMKQQLSGFLDWRKKLNAILAAGAPAEFVQELQAMGVTGGKDFVDAIYNGLRKDKKGGKAAGGMVQQIFATYRKTHTTLQNQTKLDFRNQIDQWRKAGVSMAEAMKNGFQSAQVGVWFGDWVQAKFPQVISAAVSQAVAEWKAANPPPAQPVAPRKPIRPGKPDVLKGAVVPAAQRAAVANDYSSNYVFNQNFMMYTGMTPAEARRLGFEFANRTKGALPVHPAATRDVGYGHGQGPHRRERR